MALPAELMRNVPTLEEFWAAFTKSREEDAGRWEEEGRRSLAGAVFLEGVKEAVIDAGMYVIEQSGDTMKISGFKPREW